MGKIEFIDDESCDSDIDGDDDDNAGGRAIKGVQLVM